MLLAQWTKVQCLPYEVVVLQDYQQRYCLIVAVGCHCYSISPVAAALAQSQSPGEETRLVTFREWKEWVTALSLHPVASVRWTEEDRPSWEKKSLGSVAPLAPAASSEALSASLGVT